jgi:predicted Holliday junction resolvase-like endonuclease
MKYLMTILILEVLFVIYELYRTNKQISRLERQVRVIQYMMARDTSMQKTIQAAPYATFGTTAEDEWKYGELTRGGRLWT